MYIKNMIIALAIVSLISLAQAYELNDENWVLERENRYTIGQFEMIEMQLFYNYNITIENKSYLGNFTTNQTFFINKIFEQEVEKSLEFESKRILKEVENKIRLESEKDKNKKIIEKNNKIRESFDYYYDNQTNKSYIKISDFILSDGYVTNTTREPETLNKIENFYNILPTLSYENVKDIILDSEGRLSEGILFNYERDNLGSYKLEAIGHTNRAMLSLIMWKVAKIEDKQNRQLGCWDYNTQLEIIQCMRNI